MVKALWKIKGKVKEMQIEFELRFSDSHVYKAISPTEPSQHS